jgi:hypothetical protein
MHDGHMQKEYLYGSLFGGLCNQHSYSLRFVLPINGGYPCGSNNVL